MDLRPTLAAVRFGTGLSPRIAPPADAGAILEGVRGPDRAAAAFPIRGWDAKARQARRWIDLRRKRRDGDREAEDFRAHRTAMVAEFHGDLARTVARAAGTEDGFRERLAWFWADHFTVSDGVGLLRRSVAGYHEDAIRPHVAGRFADLLIAAVTHPAMLVYLDQNRSVGPNSPRGRRGGGLNENLAREILELHTLGVEADYQQRDVRQFAELLTGLTVTKEGQAEFRRNFVEPGAEIVLGRSYGSDTPQREPILRALRDLSVHPQTARHLCRKLAQHFVEDVPSDDLVQAMAVRWLATDGDLFGVYEVLLDHPASAAPELRKVRRPLEFLAAGMRAFGGAEGLTKAGNRTIRDALLTPLKLMGQPWQKAPGPDGWPEEAAAWITAQGLAARIEWAMAVAGRRRPLPDPRAFVDTALMELATPRTRFAADAAETRDVGIGLVLASPEFQRR